MRGVMERHRTGLRGELLIDEPLAGYTTWRVGGPARRLYRPADAEDLARFLAGLDPDEPLLWLGLGSNLLVRDGGFPGTVLALQGALDDIWLDGPEVVRVEAGVSCAKAARFAAREGLCGIEFLAGIPGTLGGALAMNAGAFGGEIWKQVQKVLTVDRCGAMRERRPRDYEIGYREVRGPRGEWFLAAWLALQPGDTDAARRRIRSLLVKRNASQPIGQRSCGSVFRNPPGDHAARLIEAAGLKGLRRGGAQVSEVHANFIVNTGGATAAEIEGLIEQVRAEVERRFGVQLIPEVHRVGVEAAE